MGHDLDLLGSRDVIKHAQYAQCMVKHRPDMDPDVFNSQDLYWARLI